MNPHAQALGRLGGKARADKLSKRRRKQIAMMGVEARRAKKLSPSAT